MQIRMPGAASASTLAALRRRVSRLSLCGVLEVLLAIPSVWAGYLVGGMMSPQNPQEAQIWSLAAAGILLVLYLAAFILTLRARKAIKDTVMIQEELSARIESVTSKVNAPKE